MAEPKAQGTPISESCCLHANAFHLFDPSVDLAGFGQFLQNLKNQGMHPQLMGDFPVDDVFGTRTKPFRKPYLVQ